MATKKNNNSRKALAAALAVMGVAGLSLASAATLTVDTSNEVAIGTDTFAECDTDGVTVSYTYDATTLEIDDIVISDIAAACDTEAIYFSLEDSTTPTPVEIATGTSTVSGTSYTYDATGDNIDIATDLGLVTVVIG